MYTYSTYSGVGSSSSNMAAAGIWTIIAAILAIVGGILVYFLFVKSKTEPKGKFLKYLKDLLAFKTMWIEPVLKVFYYIATIFIVLFSFTFIGSSFLSFIICFLAGPIVIRLIYEMTMMFIMVWKNTQEIADNTKK
ncbi:hypothetical protein IJJ37_00565 [Candidatus Saccharibacteria bacterium]|nr:hypothetical protein [Candidatus Saccharibacteria bacterium]